MQDLVLNRIRFTLKKKKQIRIRFWGVKKGSKMTFFGAQIIQFIGLWVSMTGQAFNP